MKLFMVHCGFYDQELFEGTFESHADLFIAAEDFEGAKRQIKEHPAFKGRRMHVDGLQEIQAVGGYKVLLERDPQFEGKSCIIGKNHKVVDGEQVF